MIPQTQLQSHQPQISTFKAPIPPKTTTVKLSTVNIQSNPTSKPIIRPEPSIPLSSLTAIFTKANHINYSQPWIISQSNTMYPSPHQWTISWNRTPPTSTATWPPLSATSNLPVQTHTDRCTIFPTINFICVYMCSTFKQTSNFWRHRL